VTTEVHPDKYQIPDTGYLYSQFWTSHPPVASEQQTILLFPIIQDHLGDFIYIYKGYVELGKFDPPLWHAPNGHIV